MPGFTDGYALIIGIAHYPLIRHLPETVLQDAQDVYNLLKSPSHGGYIPEQMRLLLDGEATATNIRNKLRWLAQTAGRNSTVVIFFSGHGGRIEHGPDAGTYLIPYDCDPQHLRATAISGNELTELLRQIEAQRLLALFDCCYAGGTGEAKDLSPALATFKVGLREEYYEGLAQGTGRVIMASSRADEVSLVLNHMRNSLFTHHLLQAFQGQARSRGDGLLRVFDVFDYVSEAVPAQGPQHPIFKAADLENNFPIALYMGGKRATTAGGQPSSTGSGVSKSVLRQALVRSFSLEELALLCADVQEALAQDGIDELVDLEIVGGAGKPGKAHNLIEYLDRRGFLSYLETAVRRARPHALE